MDKKLIKKREIIEKSIGVIFEKGYNGAGVKDLADAAGIPKGSIYNYFENKEDYLKEALIYYYEVCNRKQFEFLKDQSLKPVERIKAFYKYMIDSFTDEDLKRGCLLGKITQEVSGCNEGIRTVTEEIQNNIIAKLVENIKEAKEKKELSLDINSEELAEFIYNSWQGTLIRIKCTRQRESLNNFYRILNGVLLK
ncbi:MAG: TetR/AcrR family transcriptional regulator [Sarcina sp.]